MFQDDNKIDFVNVTAAGTSTIDTTSYDMAGFEEITFICRLGTPNSGNNIRAQQDSVVAMGSAADLLGSLVNSATLNIHCLTISRPQKQFVRCRVTRGASTTIDGIVVIRSRSRNLPVSQPATLIGEQWRGVAEGTA